MTQKSASDRVGNVAETGPVTPLRALIVEDSENDAALLVRALCDAGYVLTWERVQSADAMRAALQRERWDVIFSDHDMPGFNSLGALEEVQKTGKDIPFIILSGSIPDEIAVEAMRRGAHDYVTKGNKSRLLPAVARELREALIRHEHRGALDTLRTREEQFRQLTENIQEVFFLIDAQNGQVVYVSPAYEPLWGKSCQSLYDRADSWCDSVYPDDRSSVMSAVEVAKVTGAFNHECRIILPNGMIRWVHARIFPVCDSAGKMLRIAGLAHDITEQKDNQDRITRLTRIHAVLSGINATIVRIDDRTQLLQEACRILVEQGRLGMAWIGLTDSVTKQVKPVASMGLGGAFLSETILDLRNGAERCACVCSAVRDNKSVIVNDIASDPRVVYREQALTNGFRSLAVFPLQAEGEVVGVLALFAPEPGYFDLDETNLLAGLAADISFALDTIAKQERLNYLAYYDVQTGLPNRAFFVMQLGETIRSHERNKEAMAILAMEATHFSTINNTLGRAVGDALLKFIASRLSESLLSVCAVARIGEASFAIAIPQLRAESDAGDRCKKLLEDMAAPFVVGGHDIAISARFGLAVFPADGGDAATLLKNAETALTKTDEAKEQYLFYAPEMQARAAKRLTLERRLRSALDNEEFVLHYQPKLALESGRITGVEALIRWQDPEHGLVPPNEFIPLLEDTGMIVDVGRWALETAGSDYRRWFRKGLQAPPVAVNVSPIQLRQGDFVEQVRTAAQIRDGSAARLDLEITETVIMENVERNIDTLQALRSMDVGIAIDDFGTGYCSLSYLVKLPVNTVKIDRTFIMDMTKSAEGLLIVSSVIAMAHSLKLTVIAEGVETAEELRILQSLKCDELQGFLISRPVPADGIESMLRQGIESVATHWRAYAKMSKTLAKPWANKVAGIRTATARERHGDN
ncbi:MAG: EAL domain-containing protein [Casimicrobiaceae bacterium]